VPGRVSVPAILVLVLVKLCCPAAYGVLMPSLGAVSSTLVTAATWLTQTGKPAAPTEATPLSWLPLLLFVTDS